ncbi:MAG: DNA polymerase III subunit chi [Rhodobacteraceae bacterium]|nr:DNA polymerase III subunit chi [Paracoccaceae bacterium]
MASAFFYHLTRSPVEMTLPMLLAKALQTGWHVIVRGQDAARLEWLDGKLWLGPEEGFLPHGLAGGDHDADQPILLTRDDANPNGAACLMAIDGSDVSAAECAGYERVCILFDGNDPGAVDKARSQWKALTTASIPAQYWSEESGKWAKVAEKQ